MFDVVKVANDSDVTVTVTQTTRGVSDMDTLSLTLEGTPSPPLTLSTLTSGEVSVITNTKLYLLMRGLGLVVTCWERTDLLALVCGL